MAGVLQIVVGGQYGSEGKGHIAGYLARSQEARRYGVAPTQDLLYAVRVAGPNAGHTVIGREHANDGTTKREWKLRQIPVAAITNPNAHLVIAAGSEVDYGVLYREIKELDDAGYDVSSRLIVDQAATLIEQQDLDEENTSGLTGRIGSTGKGIGAARARRIWREAALWGDETMNGSVHTADTAPFLRAAMDQHSARVLVEGTQGYGLGLHTPNYPHCTSSDCRAIDFLAMVGLSPWGQGLRAFSVYLTFRTRPIRVAGNSGELKDETNWSDLGLPEERTTVTNKVRRVGAWDTDLARAAIDANGGLTGCALAFTMLDQMFPDAAGITAWSALPAEAQIWVYNHTASLGAMPVLVGTGPDSIVDLR